MLPQSVRTLKQQFKVGSLNNVQELQDHDLAIDAMVSALQISHKHVCTDKHGIPAIKGKDTKPLKMIQTVEEGEAEKAYLYYVIADTKRKWSAIKSKLISFGLSLRHERDTKGYFYMRRLPSELEAKTIRGYLGLKKITIKEIIQQISVAT